jgi:hypothetical protein
VGAGALPAGPLTVGIAHHFGWAVAITAAADHSVVDRRRIALVEPGRPTAPIHTQEHHGLDDAALARIVADVRASAERATRASLDALPDGIVTLSVRAWPTDFPTDLATLRRAPYEARADSVMYREVLAEAADARGWALHRFDAASVEAQARRILGARATSVLDDPRVALGPPWGKDQRIALAAAVLAAGPVPSGA